MQVHLPTLWKIQILVANILHRAWEREKNKQTNWEIVPIESSKPCRHRLSNLTLLKRLKGSQSFVNKKTSFSRIESRKCELK